MIVNVNEQKTDNPVVDGKDDKNISQQKQEQPVIQQTQENKDQETQDNPNWRAFREARKKDRAEKEAAERKAAEKDAEVAALKAAMEAAFSKGISPLQNHQYQSQNVYQEDETEDQKIEKKVQIALAKREEEFEKAKLEREQREYPNRLVQTHSDFNSVVTAENLDYLEFHYPEVARPLKRLNDNFDKWSDIYSAIKKFVPNSTTAKKEAAKADANFAKPKSISSTGLTQNTDSDSSRLTEERKRANWERMQKTLKAVS